MRLFKSLRSRLLVFIILLLAVSLGTMGFWLIGEMRGYYMDEARRNLLRQAYLAELVVKEHFDGSNLDTLAGWVGSSSNSRATLIMPDGTVVGETERGSDTLENHLARPEVQLALSGQAGYDLRQSRTTGLSMLYAAVPSYDALGRLQGVVRLSLDTSLVMQNFSRISLLTFIGGLLALLLGGSLAFLLALQISRPLEMMSAAASNIASGNFSGTVPESGAAEIAGLAVALNTMSGNLDRQFTSVRSAAERLEAVLASMRDGVLLIDADSHIELINPAAIELLSLSASAALGQPASLLSRFPELSALLAESRLRGEALVSRVSLGGRMSQKQIRAGVMPLDSGKTLISLQDLTDVYRSLDVRRDFVANVSHELRTPLTALSLLVENLLRGALDDRSTAEDFLNRASSEIGRLTVMVEELLHLSRLESGVEEVYRQLVPAEKLISAVTEELADLLDAKELKLTREGNMAIELYCDEAKLRQVLVNFLDNAMKFAPAGSTITVGVGEDRRSAELYVKDHGPGVAAEHLPRVYERFFKGSSSRGGGTGLGLAIVKHIAEAHGGSVYVRSRYGQGATFGIRIPKDSS